MKPPSIDGLVVWDPGWRLVGNVGGRRSIAPEHAHTGRSRRARSRSMMCRAAAKPAWSSGGSRLRCVGRDGIRVPARAELSWSSSLICLSFARPAPKERRQHAMRASITPSSRWGACWLTAAKWDPQRRDRRQSRPGCSQPRHGGGQLDVGLHRLPPGKSTLPCGFPADAGGSFGVFCYRMATTVANARSGDELTYSSRL